LNTIINTLANSTSKKSYSFYRQFTAIDRKMPAIGGFQTIRPVTFDGFKCHIHWKHKRKHKKIL